jgi:hypothetical protein
MLATGGIQEPARLPVVFLGTGELITLHRTTKVHPLHQTVEAEFMYTNKEGGTG